MLQTFAFVKKNKKILTTIDLNLFIYNIFKENRNLRLIEAKKNI